MTKKRIGIIIVPPGVIVQKHEKITADFLALERGLDITFLLADRSQGVKNPDISMSGKRWEIKCPRGKSARTIENTVRQALKQSPNIVLDLRRMDGRIATKRFVNRVRLEFETVRRIGFR